MALCAKIHNVLNRRKMLGSDLMETPLKRCLNTFDLTMLGIGQMVGSGIFVLTGTVVRDMAGPATVLSYLIAGVTALLSALCYAEFGAHVPKAGSAYVYTYVTIGEFWAFLVGWNMILECVLGMSSSARAFGGLIDAIFNGTIQRSILENVGSMDATFLNPYPDFVAFAGVMFFVILIGLGAKISLNFNSALTGVNLAAILLIVVAGFVFADIENWTDGSGFMPYGAQGIFTGAATCFNAYIGFETIAVAGEEANSPAKSIPVAICISLVTVTLIYVLASSVLTLMVPYYTVDLVAPFPTAFMAHGALWIQIIVAIGSLFGVLTSLLCNLFVLPRTIYAMASDGLLFQCFAYIHPRTQTPLVAVLSFGMVGATLGLLIDMETLVEFMAIGTLMSFTMVAASVVILRYQPAARCQFQLKPEQVLDDCSRDTDDKQLLHQPHSHEDIGKLKRRFKMIPLIKDFQPEVTTTACVVIMVSFITAWCSLLVFGIEEVAAATWWAVLLLISLSGAIATCFIVLVMHEQNTVFLTFQIPFVPFLPCLSIVLNISLMLKLNYLTWLRLAVWLGLGLIIYFGYGMHHSKENKPLSVYKHVILYGGDSETVVPKLKEEMCKPQPDRILNEQEASSSSE